MPWCARTSSLSLTVPLRCVTPRPRVKAKRSRAAGSDQRWATDVTHVNCGADGWGHLAAVIDCHDRELIGWEFALRGRAKEAEKAEDLAEAGVYRLRLGELKGQLRQATR